MIFPRSYKKLLKLINSDPNDLVSTWSYLYTKYNFSAIERFKMNIYCKIRYIIFVYKNRCNKINSDYVDSWFGLSYSNYMVLHRSLLQSMSNKWQKKFIKLINELDNKCKSFINEFPDEYEVNAIKNGQKIEDKFADYRRGNQNIFIEKGIKC